MLLWVWNEIDKYGRLETAFRLTSVVFYAENKKWTVDGSIRGHKGDENRRATLHRIPLIEWSRKITLWKIHANVKCDNFKFWNSYISLLAMLFSVWLFFHIEKKVTSTICKNSDVIFHFSCSFFMQGDCWETPPTIILGAVIIPKPSLFHHIFFYDTFNWNHRRLLLN